MVQVRISPGAQRQLDRLPRKIRIRFLRIIDELERWPEISGAKPLRGDLAGHFRKRTGDYRLIFTVKGQCLLIEKVSHREDVYED